MNRSRVRTSVTSMLFILVGICAFKPTFAQLPMDTLFLEDGEVLTGTVFSVAIDQVEFMPPAASETVTILQSDIEHVSLPTLDEMSAYMKFECPGDSSEIFKRARSVFISAFGNGKEALVKENPKSGRIKVEGWNILSPSELMCWKMLEFEAENGGCHLRVVNLSIERVDGLQFSLLQLNRFGDHAPILMHEIRMFVEDFVRSMRK